MSDKPKIYGFCPAGCRWETVHKDEFNKSATWIKQYADESGVFELSPFYNYKIVSPVSSDAYSCVISLSYTDSTAQTYLFTISEYDAYRNYFFFEILSLTATETAMTIVYEVNGNRYSETVSGTAIDITNAKIKIVGASNVFIFNADASIVLNDFPPLEQQKIYGVDGVGQSDPTLTRTDDAVGLSYTVGASEIQSDFDKCYPWSDMKEVTDDLGNVFIRIPKFYAKITKNADGTYKHQISGTRYDGFSTLFVDGKGNEIDYVLVGKYEGSCDSSDYSSAKMKSVSGATIKVWISINNSRKACRNNGEGYQQYDFLIEAIIRELFMIEFATTNCQSIMKGYTVSNTAALITGHTDLVKTASGSWNTSHTEECTTCNTDGKHACKYRGIENPWGNVFKWCDGINFKEKKIFICESPSEYESNKYDAPYIYVGDAIGSGSIKTITQFAKNPLLGFVTETGATSSSYYCSYCPVEETATVLRSSGMYASGNGCGLWRWSVDSTSSSSGSDLGGRLCYKPI